MKGNKYGGGRDFESKLARKGVHVKFRTYPFQIQRRGFLRGLFDFVYRVYNSIRSAFKADPVKQHVPRATYIRNPKTINHRINTVARNAIGVRRVTY